MDANLVPFPGTADSETVKNWVSKYGDPNAVNTVHVEKNRGLELQLVKTIGVNDIIASINYDKAKHDSINTKSNTSQYLRFYSGVCSR